MANYKKWAVLKEMTPEQSQRGNYPRDFWNYNTNPITGFSISKTRGERDAETRYAEGKYKRPSQMPDAYCNGSRIPKFAKNGF